MKLSFRITKNIITKCNIPGIDYVVNPYIGCQHGCIYCYAEFMIRFTQHQGDKWGQFLDIKKFDLKSIKGWKYNGKKILFSSVTDPYIPMELKYQNTRKILERLIDSSAEIIILTKSKFVERDIDLFKKFQNVEVGISICTLDKDFAKIIEKGASQPHERIQTVKTLKENQLKTYVFISPFLPGITDFQEIIEQTKLFTDYYMFENLNFRPHNIPRVFSIIRKHYPLLVPLYQELKEDPSRWDLIAYEIADYCEKNHLNYSIEFHHGGFSKS